MRPETPSVPDNAAVEYALTRARTPEALRDFDRPIEECVAACFPRSHALFEGARHRLFCSLPVAFDPAHGEGCYLATVDRDEHGEPWRFIDRGALIHDVPLMRRGCDTDVVFACVKNANYFKLVCSEKKSNHR